MASIPLTLAALATSAVPGLQIVGARLHHVAGVEAFTSAQLTTDMQDLLIRVPNTPQAEVQLSAEVLGLAALSEGARKALPVRIPETLGMTRARDTRAVVTTFISGDLVLASDISPDALLIASLSDTIAAIHELPVAIAQSGGLPVRSASEVRDQARRLVERAVATHLVPETVHRMWLQRLSSEQLWDFEPCVVHGSLNAEQLRVSDDALIGLLGWESLSVADPAADFTWLLDASSETCDSVLSRYAQNRGVSGTRALRDRAHFYHQLEVAKWLLHGVDTHDQTVVEDAIAMLDQMVDRIGRSSALSAVHTPLDDAAVADLLAETPSVLPDPRSETAEYEALDEDRMFDFDDEFHGGPPLTAEGVDAATPLEHTGVREPDSGLTTVLPEQPRPDSDTRGGRPPE